mgnify:CR=1 FL=1
MLLTPHYSSIIANLVLFILWGNALIAQAFLFSAVFNNTRVATSKFSPFLFGWKKKNNIIFSLFSLFILFGYLTSHPFLCGQCYRYVILFSILFYLFIKYIYIFSLSLVFQGNEPPFFWMIWPPFAFYRAIFVLGINCGLGACFSTNDYDWGNELTHIWIYLFFSTMFIYLLALYVETYSILVLKYRKSSTSLISFFR